MYVTWPFLILENGYGQDEKSNRENDLFTHHCIKVYIYVNFTSLASYALFKCLLRSYLALTCNQFMNRVDRR